MANNYQNKTREILVSNLIKELNKGVIPWKKPWGSDDFLKAFNITTEKSYRGINLLNLSLASAINNYNDPRWCTFNQIKKAGWKLQKGAKAEYIEFWSFYNRKTKKLMTGAEINGAVVDMTEEEKKNYLQNIRPVCKDYAVFNASKIDGCAKYQPPKKEKTLMFEKNERCENIIKNCDAPIFEDGLDSAYYSPLNDTIHLPKRESFYSTYDFYATALHEIAHSTGHQSRLNREISNHFGNDKYAIEELRAEISSMFLGADLDIGFSEQHLENHASYIDSWIEQLKKDDTILFKAIDDAEKIENYILEKYSKEPISFEEQLNQVADKEVEWLKYNGEYEIVDEADEFENRYEELKRETLELLSNTEGRNIIKGQLIEDLKELDENDTKRIEGNAILNLIEKIEIDEKKEKANSILVIDTETTGLDAEKNEILQLSILNGNGERLYNNLFKPNATSWEEAEKINHISFEQVKNKKFFKENLKEVQEIFNKAKKIIGYSTQFDLDFLKNNGVKINENCQVVDVMKDFMNYLSEKNNNQQIERQSLVKCADYYSYEWGNGVAHDSLEDCKATLYCYEKMQEKKQNQIENNISKEKTLDNETRDNPYYMTPSEYYKNKNLKRLNQIENNIPKEMKEKKNWCVFKTYYNKENNKKKKVIISPITKHWAKCNQSSDWASFDEALKFAKENNAEGLSYAMSKEQNIICVDLDHCIKDKGMKTDLAWNLLNLSEDTYAEKSVSGTGLHIFFKGDAKGFEEYNKHIEAKGLECYVENKFMSVTGNQISKTNELKDCKKLDVKLKEELGKKVKAVATRNNYINNYSLNDNELIDKIKNSRMGDTFDRLYNGENLCGDNSRSDAKLLNIIGYFSNCNKLQMENIFRNSGLYREEKGDAYVKRTIDFVCNTMITPMHITSNNKSSSKGKSK